jgi:hypothetical protein
MAQTISLLALLLALVALTVAVRAWQRSAPPDPGAGLDAVPEDVLGLRQEVAALRAEGGLALRHVAVVRYDAFADTGGQLSWSLALLDDHGDGVVLTSIHGRSDARAYAKNLTGWSGQQLSPEELQAVEHARG